MPRVILVCPARRQVSAGRLSLCHAEKRIVFGRSMEGFNRTAKLDEGGVWVGWVARTRLLAEPLSPRGPQPIVTDYILKVDSGPLQWPDGPTEWVRRC